MQKLAPHINKRSNYVKSQFQENHPVLPSEVLRSFNWVHMGQASCILLGSALSKSSWVGISEWRWLNDSVKWPCSPLVLLGQWIERPPGIWEVMGFIPVGGGFFSLSHTRPVPQFTFPKLKLNEKLEINVTIHLRRPWTSAFFGSLQGPLVLVRGWKILVMW